VGSTAAADVSDPAAPEGVQRAGVSPLVALGSTTALAGPHHLVALLVPAVVPLVSTNKANQPRHHVRPPPQKCDATRWVLRLYTSITRDREGRLGRLPKS
jgi:hypothetical protein